MVAAPSDKLTADGIDYWGERLSKSDDLLRSLGADPVVEEPTSLRDQLNREFQELLLLYTTTSSENNEPHRLTAHINHKI